MLFLTLLIFISAGLFSLVEGSRKGVEHRRQLDTKTLAKRGPPDGGFLYAQDGNDGGGCYNENSSARVLPEYVGNDANNAIESCLSTCEVRGFKLGGVQYGTQCYCGNALPQDLTPANSSDCNSPCPGKSYDMCGGTWKMNIYTHDVESSPSNIFVKDYELKGCVVDGGARALTGFSYTSSQMTAETCVTECSGRGFHMAGVQNGRECFCGNAFFNGVGQSIDPKRCDQQCVGDGGSNCGGWWAMSIYARQTPAPEVPQGWKSNGCFGDTAENRVLIFKSQSPDMTAATCMAQCERDGVKYAGIEGTECYCGSQLKAEDRLGDDRCSAICGGGGASGCGGPWALSVYEFDSPQQWSIENGASYTTTLLPSGWSYVQCGTDAGQRALPDATFTDQKMTILNCLSFCGEQSFRVAGIEAGGECYCADSLQNGQGTKVGDEECSSVCGGDQSPGQCGGQWRLSLFTSLDESARTTVFGSGAPSSADSTVSSVATDGAGTAASSAATTDSSSTTSTDSASASSSSHIPAEPRSTSSTGENKGDANDLKAPISGRGTKYVWANFIVGNTYSYSIDTWKEDILKASESGIDGFVLDFGTDDWQVKQMKDAYRAAEEVNGDFKMMLSFNFDHWKCDDDSKSGDYRQIIHDFLGLKAAAEVNGKKAISSFQGQACSFGQGSTNQGWAKIFDQDIDRIYFMPAYTSDPKDLEGYDIDAEVNWGSAYPEGKEPIDHKRDEYYMSLLDPQDKKYVATVSPLYASHLEGKNSIWRGDDWLLAQRFEDLMTIRDRLDQILLISWNDYGGSSYIGPIRQDLPEGSSDYVNNFPHEDILSLAKFYSTAWKEGKWPTIEKDQIWLMTRPHTKEGDFGELGAPENVDVTDDKFYAQVHLTDKSTVTLCSEVCSSFDGEAGINRFSQPLVVNNGVSIVVTRDKEVIAKLIPDFEFKTGEKQANFNYLIKTS